MERGVSLSLPCHFQSCESGTYNACQALCLAVADISPHREWEGFTKRLRGENCRFEAFGRSRSWSKDKGDSLSRTP